MKVGLTGGIGSGKSTVSARLAEHGAVVIDADLLAREVVAAGTPGLAEIVTAFGPDVVGPDGELDRAEMGRRVFGDDQARARLEQIIHPRVRARAAEIEAAAGDDAVVVHDIPLLVDRSGRQLRRRPRGRRAAGGAGATAGREPGDERGGGEFADRGPGRT